MASPLLVPVFGKSNMTIVVYSDMLFKLEDTIEAVDEIIFFIAVTVLILVPWNIAIALLCIMAYKVIGLMNGASFLVHQLVLFGTNSAAPISPLPTTTATSPTSATTATNLHNDTNCYISGSDNDDDTIMDTTMEVTDEEEEVNEEVALNITQHMGFAFSFDELKRRIYDGMKQQSTKYCFVRCLEIADQVIFINAFVQLITNRYAEDCNNIIISVLTCGSISIQDFKIVMKDISHSLHNQYRVFRKAYFGENAGSLQISDRCTESFDCLMEVYGQCTTLRNSFNLLIHRNHISRYRGIRSAHQVNKAVGLGLWCDPQQTISDSSVDC